MSRDDYPNLPAELAEWSSYYDSDPDVEKEIEETVRRNGGPTVGGYIAEADAYRSLPADWIEPILAQFKYATDDGASASDVLRAIFPLAIAQAKRNVLAVRRMLCSLELAQKKLEELLVEQQKTKD